MLLVCRTVLAGSQLTTRIGSIRPVTSGTDPLPIALDGYFSNAAPSFGHVSIRIDRKKRLSLTVSSNTVFLGFSDSPADAKAVPPHFEHVGGLDAIRDSHR